MSRNRLQKRSPVWLNSRNVLMFKETRNTFLSCPYMQFLNKVLCIILESSQNFLDGSCSSLVLVEMRRTFQRLYNKKRALFWLSSLSCSSSLFSHILPSHLWTKAPLTKPYKNLWPQEAADCGIPKHARCPVWKAGLCLNRLLYLKINQEA